MRKTIKGPIARAVVCAVLTGVVAFGGMVAPMPIALADQGATVTLYTSDHVPATNPQYAQALLVFGAESINNAQSNEGGQATGVTWGSGVQAVLIGDNQALNATGVSGFLTLGSEQTGASESYLAWLVGNQYLKGDNARAQTYGELDQAGKVTFNEARYAADYIGEQIAQSNAAGTAYETTTTAPNIPAVTAPSSFAYKLASALTNATSGVQGGISTGISGASFALSDNGYYLLSGGAARPLWLPFDASGGALAIYEKSVAPGLQKEVAEGQSGTDFAKVVDAGNGEVVTFRLTATLPAATYSKIVFTDTLPAGVTFDWSNARLAVSSTGIGPTPLTADDFRLDLSTPGRFTYTYWDSENAKEKALDLSGTNDDVTIAVTYEALVNGNAQLGASTLNTNRATLTYGEGQAVTAESEASFASFDLEIVKTDSASGERLGGAEFSIQDVEDANRYLTDGGTKVANKATFSVAAADDASTPDVNEKGLARVAPIDAGTYLVTEVTAPAGYDKVEPFLITVAPRYDQETGMLLSVDVATQSASDSGATSATATADVGSGAIVVTVPNVAQNSGLPITGMVPSEAMTMIGLVAVGVGALAMLVNRMGAFSHKGKTS